MGHFSAHRPLLEMARLVVEVGECTVMGNRQQHVDSDGGALRRSRALSSTSRVDILTRLRKAPSPLTAGALADAMGIHHTAVRGHLTVLTEAGLVETQRLPIEGRGRPRTGYTAAADSVPYLELAGMLADAVRAGRSAREAGRDAGMRVQPSADGPLATLLEETQRLGFQPQLGSGPHEHELVLRACPFAELATAQPETVCELHMGLAEGIVERAGGLEVRSLRLADPKQGGCRIVLRVTAT